MNAVIDLGREILIDRSQVRTPHVRLLLAAIGKELVVGSSWVVVQKRLAGNYALVAAGVPAQRGASELG